MSLSMESSKRQAEKFMLAVTAVVVLAAKRARRLPRRLKAAAPAAKEEWMIELRSKKKKLLSQIGSKTMPFMRGKKEKKRGEEDWGKGGVWQKTILMGDKCEPLDFSGVIYYDSNGKQVNEMRNNNNNHRSPRASPVPAYYFIAHNTEQHHHH